MFTGIIEGFGEVKKLIHENENLHITMESPLTPELKIDQSVAHNGVCLTVIAIEGTQYTVTAIQESLDKTNLSDLKVGSKVNIERAMKLGARLDGHIVQGHVDTITTVSNIEEVSENLWNFFFSNNSYKYLVDKGSITINGVSLTLVSPSVDTFSVAIIRETYDRTNFNNLKVDSPVNVEFDIMAKYVERALNDK